MKIIDEFTGRILDGRRWSEGLHQAVEAKEGVRVQEENQTLATITLQNYFRMYDKLAGMTGTALTEANEFMKIYKLPVVEIPTNRPMVRADRNDQIFKTKDGKWAAVAREIAERHEAGQPVLVGTISVEVSEVLVRPRCASAASRTRCSTPSPSTPSARARSSPRPAAPARSRSPPTWPAAASTSSSAATPSTSRSSSWPSSASSPATPTTTSASPRCCPASRRKVEEDREQVLEAGGLFICGTERHESRRIDNQLRGRAGRQGDPGESRFFLSAEDDLVRLFAGDRIYRILDRLGPTSEEGHEEPIEAKMLSKQIEGAQRKVEEQNFLIRKRVLEYDDVMNQQREIVYQYRDEVLEGRDMGPIAREQIDERHRARSSTSTRPATTSRSGTSTGCGRSSTRSSTSTSAPRSSTASRSTARSSSGCSPRTRCKLYDEREDELGEELMRALERYLLLQIIDQRWREHLYDMDYLREGIHLRGFAQIEPIVAYKNEAFTLFQDLMNTIWSDFARMVFNVEVEIEGENGGAATAAARGSRPPAVARVLGRHAPRTSRAPTASDGEGEDARGRRRR